jgi:hypothetical protein
MNTKKIYIIITIISGIKPGLCPNPTRISSYSDCRTDDNCQGNLKCCRSLGRTTLCTQPRLETITTPKPAISRKDKKTVL